MSYIRKWSGELAFEVVRKDQVIDFNEITIIFYSVVILTSDNADFLSHKKAREKGLFWAQVYGTFRNG